MDNTHASLDSFAVLGLAWATALGAALGLHLDAPASLALATATLGAALFGWTAVHVAARRRESGYTWTQFAALQVTRGLLRCRYRLEVTGLEHLPRRGKVLLVANHVSYADAVLMAACLPRRVRFLSNASLQGVPLVGSALRLAGVIPVSPREARPAIRAAVRALDSGEVVGIFPEGHLTRDGLVAPFQDGFRLIARRAQAPVIPVCLDGLWGSVFSYKGGRFFWKWPQRSRRVVRVSLGPAVTADMSAAEARQLVLDQGVDAFHQRVALRGHVAAWTVEALARRASEVAVVDHATGRRELKAGALAAAALRLSGEIRRVCPERRVGIVLPPGLGGILANLAVSLAGKTPVNLNYTLGRSALERCFEKAGVATVLTAGPVRTQIDQKMPGFPWPERTLDLRELAAATPKWKVALTLVGLKLCGAKSMLRRYGVPELGDGDEAALLFTSGSDGDPKGVVLTHRNLIGNALQVADCGVLPQGMSLLANLPIFHSFGFTVQLWTALGVGVKVVCTPSPLDFKKTAEVIEAEQCDILLGTPTFFRPYLKRVEPEQLRSLKIVVAGAEKTPDGFHEAWETRFPNSKYLEGYGLTETSPVVAVNVPDTPASGDFEGTTGTRRGTVGRLFTGMAARVQCPDSGVILPVGEVGVLQLRGANVFTGYLDNPGRTAEVIEADGWFRTGDLARLDPDGFLRIEGRLSRFSKIGGEMVPHGTVETALAKAFGVADAETPQLAVSARADASKGEALVLFARFDVDAAALRDKAKAAGLANLWTPKEIRRVEVIPTMASGKLDLKALKKLAENS